MSVLVKIMYTVYADCFAILRRVRNGPWTYVNLYIVYPDCFALLRRARNDRTYLNKNPGRGGQGLD